LKKSLIFILLVCFLTACDLEQTSEVTADQKQEQLDKEREKEEAKAKKKEEKELQQLEKEQKAQEKERQKEQEAEEKAKEKAEEKAKKEKQKQEKEIAKKAEEEEKLKEKAKKKQEKLGYTAEDVKLLKEHWKWQIEESNGMLNNITTMDPDDYEYILIYVNDSVKNLTDTEKEKFANEWGNKIKNGVTANLYGGNKEKNKASYEFRYSDDKLFARKKILGDGFTVK
jgi:membrane protein involved in colicin uptake